MTRPARRPGTTRPPRHGRPRAVAPCRGRGRPSRRRDGTRPGVRGQDGPTRPRTAPRAGHALEPPQSAPGTPRTAPGRLERCQRPQERPWTAHGPRNATDTPQERPQGAGCRRNGPRAGERHPGRPREARTAPRNALDGPRAITAPKRRRKPLKAAQQPPKAAQRPPTHQGEREPTGRGCSGVWCCREKRVCVVGVAAGCVVGVCVDGCCSCRVGVGAGGGLPGWAARLSVSARCPRVLVVLGVRGPHGSRGPHGFRGPVVSAGQRQAGRARCPLVSGRAESGPESAGQAGVRWCPLGQRRRQGSGSAS